MEVEAVLIGLAGGLAATGVMTLLELPFWKRWGLRGILEWHENQVLTCRFFKLDEKRLRFSGIFGLHFLNGALGGLGLAVALGLIPALDNIPLIALTVGYGLFLWVVTLIPIHKPITGVDPWSHPLGRGPVVASLGGHLLYGVILGLFFFLTGDV
jgi:hypothetical protein